MLLTFIKLPFVFKTFVLSIFEWPLKTGFTVTFQKIISGILSECKTLWIQIRTDILSHLLSVLNGAFAKHISRSMTKVTASEES